MVLEKLKINLPAIFTQSQKRIKMMKKTVLVLKSLVYGALLIGIIGCGKPPQPYNEKIKNTHSDISDKEKQQLLNIALRKKNTYLYDSGSVDGCFNYNLSGGGGEYKFKYRNCFIIKDDNIERIDKSACGKHFLRGKPLYDIGCNYNGKLSEKYSNFLNNIQKTLSSGLEDEITKYKKFTKLYEKSFNKAESGKKDKIAKIKTTLVDNTNVLSKNVLKEFSSFEFISVPAIKKSAMVLYKTDLRNTLKDETSLAHMFKITSMANKKHHGRYMVQYKQDSFEEDYDKFPLNIKYEIDTVHFSYLPKQFLASDGNIDFEVINNPLGKNSKFDGRTISHINITNKTKEFIEVDTIAGYYGDDVQDDVLGVKELKRVKISPMSRKTLKIYDYEYVIHDYPSSTNKLLLVNNKNQKINYGFSVGYKMLNRDRMNNLYKVNQYSINDFK